MSFQAQPQQQQQQPVQVYPTSVTNQPPSQHSNGSFGTVFIVLAVIIVISALACFLGGLCNRRHHHGQSHGGHSQKPVKQQNHNHNHNHNQNQNHHFRTKEGDVELGFDKRIPTAKPNGLGPGPGFGGVGGSRGPKLHVNGGGGGDMKGLEMKIGEDGNLRAGA